jgi:hypothetical protein
MPEIELYGRIYRSPVPLPPGYLLVPILAVALLAHAFSSSAGVRRDVAEIVADGPERLALIEAELDRTDPGWRLDRILSGRRLLPEDENSARRVEAVLRELPTGWTAIGPTGKPGPEVQALATLKRPDLGVRLDAASVREVEAILAPLRPAPERARSLADMDEGQHELAFAANPLETPLKLTQQTRSVAQLLELDAMERAQRDDLAGAIDSCRAILGASRSIGDEPFLISNLVREAIDEATVITFERVLALGEPPPDALESLQRDLIAEGERSRLRDAIRGERAMMNDLLDKLATGQLSVSNLSSSAGGDVARVGDGPGAAFYRHNQVMELETLTEAVEVAGRPPHTWWRYLDRFEAKFRPKRDEAHRLADVFHDLLTPSLARTFEAEGRTLASLRVVALLAASERYRQSRGRWPDAAAELVPEFLDAVPLDPYTGEPLRLTHKADRLVGYAVGRDGQDDGGTLNPRNLADVPETDVGHVALDPGRRGRPPGAGEPDSTDPSVRPDRE